MTQQQERYLEIVREVDEMGSDKSKWSDGDVLHHGKIAVQGSRLWDSFDRYERLEIQREHRKRHGYVQSQG
jgi:hypothetical protein